MQSSQKAGSDDIAEIKLLQEPVPLWFYTPAFWGMEINAKRHAQKT